MKTRILTAMFLMIEIAVMAQIRASDSTSKAQESQPNSQDSKAVSQRGQSEVSFDSAEREQARPQVKVMRPKRVRMTQEQMIGMPPGGHGGHGSRQKDIKYTGAMSLTAAATETGKTYESSKSDESALLIATKEAVTISQPTINKTGDSDSGDNCSFYGVNAALLVKGGSTTTIKGGTIVTNGTGQLIKLRSMPLASS